VLINQYGMTPLSRAKKRKREKDTATDPTPISAYAGTTTRENAATEPTPISDPDDATTFPFLQLPAELRLMVYNFALVDTLHTIRFGVTTSKVDGRCIVQRFYRARRGPADRDDLPEQTKGSLTKSMKSYRPDPTFPQFVFGVNILQVCRQTNAEAAPIFYGDNMFGLEATPHLHVFLIHFQHRLPLVKQLGISRLRLNPHTSSVPKELSSKRLIHAFLLLVEATNLKALYLHIPFLQSLAGKEVIAAHCLFYYEGFHKLAAAMGQAKGDSLAVLEVLKLPAVTDRVLKHPKWSMDKAKQDNFMATLARSVKLQEENRARKAKIQKE
jgi:hypothetical protein